MVLSCFKQTSLSFVIFPNVVSSHPHWHRSLVMSHWKTLMTHDGHQARYEVRPREMFSGLIAKELKHANT